jgi:glyoxylase-like metal-dependent hydrolase (beta-lactamase superfamily II)
MERYVRQLKLGPMDNFVYLVGAAGAREVAVVDPAWDVDAILAAAAGDGKEIAAALLTHHHNDHINGLQPLLERTGGVPAYAQRAEIEFSPALQRFGKDLTAVGPGERIDVGPMRITCVHTPGHTPGAQCFHFDEALVSGDTVFVGGCGRCDLPGGDPQRMFDSLHRVIGSLPGETTLFPGHDYGGRPTSTLADEKAHNPYFLRGDLGSFVAYRMRPRT